MKGVSGFATMYAIFLIATILPTSKVLTHGIVTGHTGSTFKQESDNMSEKNELEEPETGGEGGTIGKQISSIDTLEMLKWVLDGIQGQIRFADSKAAFVVIFHTFLFGFLITQAETLAGTPNSGRDCLYWMRIALMVGYGITSLTSIAYAIGAVLPKFGERAPNSHVFFGHIVAKYARNYDGYHKDVLDASNEDWLGDLTSQIVENSNIALEKHKRARVAAAWAVAAILFAFFSIVLHFLNLSF
jgi:hypothetical protein